MVYSKRDISAPVRIGIRPSPLALKQADEALDILKKIYPDNFFVIKTIATIGDKDKKTPLSQVEGSDFFTKEIDEALLEGVIDIAIHSAKDLPDTLLAGLVVVIKTPSISPYDALVSRNNLKFMELPIGSRIGASSRRRKEEIKANRNDLVIVDIRGNIGERLSLIDKGDVDAVVVAHAAMIRLGLEEKIAEIFSRKIFKTDSRQGSLAVVVRKN